MDDLLQCLPWQEPGTPAKTYRVIWAWGEPETILTGLDRETADAAAEGLNATAARYGHGKEYTVEEE